MVINIGALKSGQNELVESDIKAVVDASGDKLVKVIIETCLLSYDEKVQACQLAKLAGADFVKTSTGFSTGGATIEDVELMREVVGPNMRVKACLLYTSLQILSYGVYSNVDSSLKAAVTKTNSYLEMEMLKREFFLTSDVDQNNTATIYQEYDSKAYR